MAQGLTTGIGFGMLLLPNVAAVSQDFSTKRAFAFVIAASGTSLGDVFYTVIFRTLQPRVGFRWATRTRIVASIMLGTLVIPVLGMKLRGESSTTGHDYLDLTAFKAKPYLVFCLSNFFGFMGIYIFCGAFVSSPGIIVITISPNLKTISIQLGMALSISGFGMLIGEPIAGAMLDANSEQKGLQAFCGATIFPFGAFALLARFYRIGPVLVAKAQPDVLPLFMNLIDNMQNENVGNPELLYNTVANAPEKLEFL
ncbi:hypothetical protein ACHAO1_002725 [Botrytis cinerea]